MHKPSNFAMMVLGFFLFFKEGVYCLLGDFKVK